jgi:hypothetical protein
MEQPKAVLRSLNVRPGHPSPVIPTTRNGNPPTTSLMAQTTVSIHRTGVPETADQTLAWGEASSSHGPAPAVEPASYRHRCHTPVFGQEAYDKACVKPLFWKMSVELAHHPEHGLARMWQLGRSSLVSVLPVLGQYADAPFAAKVDLSKEKIARLTGRNPATVARAAKVLEELGLGSASTLNNDFGERITRWNVKSLSANSAPGTSSSTKVFSVNAKLLYGGHWRQLTGTQHAVYLGAGSVARTFSDPEKIAQHLRRALGRGYRTPDIDACRKATGRVRLATVSYARLHRLTGVSTSALKDAVQPLKHPDVWAGSANDPAILQYQPITVYRTEGALLYHFRDHALPWPWAVLNRELVRGGRHE